MTRDSRKRYGLICCMILLNIIWVILWKKMPGVILIGTILYIPAAIYTLKYDIDQLLIVGYILLLVSIGLILGKAIVIYSVLVILPQLVLLRLLKFKRSIKDTGALFSLVLLICIISVIGVLNEWYYSNLL